MQLSSHEIIPGLSPARLGERYQGNVEFGELYGHLPICRDPGAQEKRVLKKIDASAGRTALVGDGRCAADGLRRPGLAGSCDRWLFNI